MPGKKKPVELKILRVTGKQAEKLIKGRTPTPGPLTDSPDWFTAEQRAAWRYAIDNAPRDILRKIDKAVLAGFIVAEDTHRKACIEMAKAQLIVQSPKQSLPMQNPYLAIINRQMVLMIRAASELGFSPCSRARVDAGKPAATVESGWEDVG